MTTPSPKAWPRLSEARLAILARIEEIESDTRYNKDGKHAATVFENAPLALMQMGWESEVKALRWVLQVPLAVPPRTP